MTRPIGLDLHDHVRWLDTFASSTHFDLLRDGRVSVTRLKTMQKMINNTLKLAKQVNSWEAL